jgi:hypothetical protein
MHHSRDNFLVLAALRRVLIVSSSVRLFSRERREDESVYQE